MTDKPPISARAGGARQRIWAALRRGPASTSDLAAIAGCAEASVRGYLSVLAEHGYIATDGDGRRVLLRDTGPRSPAVSLSRRTVWDWNLRPPMAPAELRAIWQASGLSLNGFGVAIGVGAHKGTHIRQMIDGRRPVGPSIEAGARRLARHLGKS